MKITWSNTNELTIDDAFSSQCRRCAFIVLISVWSRYYSSSKNGWWIDRKIRMMDFRTDEYFKSKRPASHTLLELVFHETQRKFNGRYRRNRLARLRRRSDDHQPCRYCGIAPAIRTNDMELGNVRPSFSKSYTLFTHTAPAPDNFGNHITRRPRATRPKGSHQPPQW